MQKENLIAYLDILGYKNLLLNNDLETVNGIISDLVLLPSSVVGKIEKYKHFSEDAMILKIVKNDIKSLIISDTIILYLSPSCEDEFYLNVCNVLFIYYIIDFFQMCLLKGLPVRGALNMGEFLIKENCFGGKAIIDCHNDSMLIDLSGVLISESAIESIGKSMKILKLDYSIDAFIIKYLPFKETSKNLQIINWWDESVEKMVKEKYLDVEQFIFESFCSHKKIFEIGAREKLKNTMISIRSMIMENRLNITKISMD